MQLHLQTHIDPHHFRSFQAIAARLLGLNTVVRQLLLKAGRNSACTDNDDQCNYLDSRQRPEALLKRNQCTLIFIIKCILVLADATANCVAHKHDISMFCASVWAL